MIDVLLGLIWVQTVLKGLLAENTGGYRVKNSLVSVVCVLFFMQRLQNKGKSVRVADHFSQLFSDRKW